VLLVSLSDSAIPTAAAPPHTSPTTALGPAHTRRPLLGDTLALIAAAVYALYVILLKVRIRSESRIDMQLFFGFVGLFNALSFWPMALLLHFLRVETLEWPDTGKGMVAILLNVRCPVCRPSVGCSQFPGQMAITLSSDYIYVLAMLKTRPIVVTVGLSLTIPLAVLGDFFLKRPAHLQVIIGAVLVLVSFIAVGIECDDDEKDEKFGRRSEWVASEEQ
jgi:solute carrier family 35, member F5